MSDFTVLQTKRNLFGLFISKTGNLIGTIIIAVIALNLLLGIVFMHNVGYCIGNTITYLGWLIFSKSEITDDEDMALRFILPCLTVSLAISNVIFLFFLPIEPYNELFINFLCGFLIMVLTPIGLLMIFLLIACFMFLLYIPYETFMTYWIQTKLPTTKEELIACGVKNRIDCILYYLYMQTGFKKGMLWPNIPLYLYKEEYPGLIDICYSFPVKEEEFIKMSSYLLEKYHISTTDGLTGDLFPEYSHKRRKDCLTRILSNYYDKKTVRNILLDLTSAIK